MKPNKKIYIKTEKKSEKKNKKTEKLEMEMGRDRIAEKARPPVRAGRDPVFILHFVSICRSICATSGDLEACVYASVCGQ